MPREPWIQEGMTVFRSLPKKESGMKIIVTPGEATRNHYWLELCHLRGISVWAVNEGLMEADEEITLTEEEARKLKIIL